MVKVSIIVPVYNTSAYIEKCAESLFAQTLLDIEIIFVDDGSTDNSISLLPKDSRIKILSQPHQGQSVARNLGVSHATGEYIGFVDSDDWIDSTMFEKLYALGGDIAMCDFTIFDGEFKKDSYMNLDLFTEEVFSPLSTLSYLFRICVSPCNKIYKRALVRPFAPNLAFEDNLFFLETYLAAENIAITREALYFYRRGHNSTTTDDIKKFDLFEIFKLMEHFLYTTPYWESLKDKFFIHKKNTLNYWHKKIKDQALAKKFCEAI